MPSTTNKVKFGLKNCHYAKATLDLDTNTMTFGTPVAIPGAVNLSMDPEGDNEPFYADDMVYYMTSANNGYSGDLEIALLPDSFRKDILRKVFPIRRMNGWTSSGHFPSIRCFRKLSSSGV